MLPSVGADSIKIVRYGAEVGGRILGVAAMTNLVPDPTRRTALITAGNTILASTQGLNVAFFARHQFENFEQRTTVGKSKGIDRGFDAFVAFASEAARTSLADRRYQNPDYRAIFPNGTEEYISPTIREDEQIATELHAAIQASNLPVKSEMLAVLDGIIPVVAPAAKALIDGEKQVNALFQAEINARKTVVDTLWEQRKIVETNLGRAGKYLARFIFFDFRKSNDADSSSPATPDSQEPSPNEGG